MKKKSKNIFFLVCFEAKEEIEELPLEENYHYKYHLLLIFPISNYSVYHIGDNVQLKCGGGTIGKIKHFTLHIFLNRYFMKILKF